MIHLFLYYLIEPNAIKIKHSGRFIYGQVSAPTYDRNGAPLRYVNKCTRCLSKSPYLVNGRLSPPNKILSYLIRYVNPTLNQQCRYVTYRSDTMPPPPNNTTLHRLEEHLIESMLSFKISISHTRQLSGDAVYFYIRPMRYFRQPSGFNTHIKSSLLQYNVRFG